MSDKLNKMIDDILAPPGQTRAEIRERRRRRERARVKLARKRVGMIEKSIKEMRAQLESISQEITTLASKTDNSIDELKTLIFSLSNKQIRIVYETQQSPESPEPARK
jgi:seryl-tRNA synthetase